MKYFSSAIALAITLTGCAAPPPIAKQTASGKPEVLLKNTSLAAAKGKLLERCALRGMAIEEQSSIVICTKTLDGAEGTLAQLAVGNAASTPAVRKSSFLVTQRGEDVLVLSTGHLYWTQMPGGQVRTQPVSGNLLHNTTQEFLDSL